MLCRVVVVVLCCAVTLCCDVDRESVSRSSNALQVIIQTMRRQTQHGTTALNTNTPHQWEANAARHNITHHVSHDIATPSTKQTQHNTQHNTHNAHKAYSDPDKGNAHQTRKRPPPERHAKNHELHANGA